MYDKYTPVYVGRLFLVLHLNCSNSVTVMTTAQTLSFRGAKRRGNPLKRNETQWRLPLTALVFAITTAQKIFAIS